MNKIFYVLILTLFSLPAWSVIHKLGSYDTPGFAKYVKVLDNIAYVADRESGLQIIDVSNPQNPQLLGSYDTPANTSYVDVVDTLAYLTDTVSGLLILNVADPTNPHLLSTFSTGYPLFLTVVQDKAYVGTSTGLYIVDVSNPQNPILQNHYDESHTIYAVDIVDDIAYITCEVHGLMIVNISDPLNPQLMGSYDDDADSFIQVEVRDSLAFINATNAGIILIDVSNQTNPQLVSVLNIDSDFSFTISDNKLYTSTIDCYDISNPLEPLFVSCYIGNGYAFSSNVIGSTLYAAAYDEGLEIIDFSAPENELLVGYLHDCSVYSIELKDNLIYAMGSHVFKVIDVTLPENPLLLSTCSSTLFMVSFTLKDSLAYLACAGGISILDISDPLNPHEVAVYNMFDNTQYANSIAFEGNIAYVADHNGLTILDTTDSLNPIEIGSYHHGTSSYVQVRGTTVFLTNSNSTLEILDVSNPQNIQLLSSINLQSYPYSFEICNNAIYVAEGSSGMEVINIINTLAPVFVETILPHPSSSIQACYVKNSHLFISDLNWNEIGIYDISIPQQPVIVNNISWNLGTSDMCINNNLLYTSNNTLNILDLSSIVPVPVSDQICATDPLLTISNYPNPFNPNTTISFDILHAGLVKLDIYNIRGQKVKSLLNDQFAQGRHKISWNGTDDKCKSVASCVYFARICIDGISISRKMVLVK